MTTTASNPPARLGMTLFLASESMFLLGVMSAYYVLRAGNRELFAGSAAVLSKPIIAAQVALLIAASVAAMKWSRLRAAIVVALLVAYGMTQGVELFRLTARRGTMAFVENGNVFVVDGTVSTPFTVTGRKAAVPDGFDIHSVTPATIEAMHPADVNQIIVTDAIRATAHYGPSRNNYFGCYFLLTIAHAVHVAAGLMAVLWLMYRPSAVGTVIVRSYVQFFNAAGIILLLVLALG